MSSNKRAVIFANGVFNDLERLSPNVQPEDLLIAADGGLRHCRDLGFTPSVLIGDFDSIDRDELAEMDTIGTKIIYHPADKDYTDLELALLYARDQGVDEILILAALGARWDQTLANLFLLANTALEDIRIFMVDGSQEVSLLRGESEHTIYGQPGDTVSLIPIGGDAHGISTQGLAYPLNFETLYFGATRGISNVLQSEQASIHLESGLLLCVVTHKNGDA